MESYSNQAVYQQPSSPQYMAQTVASSNSGSYTPQTYHNQGDPNQIFAENEALRTKVASLEQQLERERKRGQPGMITTSNSAVRWGDADMNNPVQLRDEIGKLETRLKRFLDMKNTAQGVPIQFSDVHVMQIRKLFEKYGLSKDFSQVPSLDLTAVLQRHFIEYVLEETKNWIGNMGKRSKRSFRPNDHLEADIVNATNNLILLLHELRSQPGDDELSISNVTTIRQNVSASLRVRGFEKQNHSFIKDVSDEIVTRLGSYRPIAVGEEVSLNVEAANIVKRVVKVLHFGLRAQEHVPKVLFFDAGEQLDGSVMAGTGDFSKETIAREEVSICGFPLIAGDPKSPYDKSVLYKATVRTRPRVQINAQPQVAQHGYAQPLQQQTAYATTQSVQTYS